VYRYFATKAELVAAVILREEEAFIARVSRAIEGQPELRPAMEALVAECLRAARDHPLLDRLLQAEPEALLPYLLTSRSPVLSAAAPVAEDLLRSWLPHLSETEVHRAADAITRLLVSYGVTPPEDSIEEVASGLATLLVTGLKEV
jgi:AcrR family transcriptional regulator